MLSKRWMLTAWTGFMVTIAALGEPPAPPAPTIKGAKYFLANENFTLNCKLKYEHPLALVWTTPLGEEGMFDDESIIINSNENARDLKFLYKNITVTNATAKHAGTYVCTSANANGRTPVQFEKILLDKPHLEVELKGQTNNSFEVSEHKMFRKQLSVKSYPPAQIILYRQGSNKVLANTADPIPTNKYKIDRNKNNDYQAIAIKDCTLKDIGNYTLFVNNGHLKQDYAFGLIVRTSPEISFNIPNDRTYMVDTIATFKCNVDGYPLPKVQWIFSANGEEIILTKRAAQETKSLYSLTSTLDMTIKKAGNLTCKAENTENVTAVTHLVRAYEVSTGLGIKGGNSMVDNYVWFAEEQDYTLVCLASIYFDYKNVTWVGDGDQVLDNVNYTRNDLSLMALLRLENVTMDNSGVYTCRGEKNNNVIDYRYANVTVEEKLSPEISLSVNDADGFYERQSAFLTCVAKAVPKPVIVWYKDGVKLKNNTDAELIIENPERNVVNSTVKIDHLYSEHKGKYKCVVTSGAHAVEKNYELIMSKVEKRGMMFGIIFAIIGVLLIMVLYLTWKIRKEKALRKELAAAGLLYFKDGAMESINPELGIDEQAELLPYDEKFEFPPDKLVFGKQLGAGAFGIVYKAEARGIINAEETTTVAVKMVKKTADNMYIKALASELKIMVHLGKHINIVNLLGACTKNVGKRELRVIVEYCKFGNIHNYMQKHREVFIDQLTDNKEKGFGKINRGYSSSSANSGMHSDYFGSNQTQETDHTFVNTANSVRSARKVSETGYVQPEWRSNYESDYSEYEARAPRPLSSRDLLAWAFQIARGMEYLANRKVLHGDLAARNVLLAEDNIVKICDFGFARSIYKNDEYQKQENSPLPLKWLAIECMTDRIFSTQSDVWSFGVVLWELFSLAKTPYPNISPQNLLQVLSEGHRLNKPQYADDRLYSVMRQCWEQKPTSRPSFGQLQETLGSFLEDNVRNHYVDLNSSYLNMNNQRQCEDYLAMMCAPDYNILVTPSPHHYVNENQFFPPNPPAQLTHDDEGYLQMSPARRQPTSVYSPRAIPGGKFDFDARKLSPRDAEANSQGNELTPMLTLNSLSTRSGSESDHEGNTSPYLNPYPRIDEEDEVFEKNEKNMHNTAVTNPTYISFDVDSGKKPDIINNYVNVSAPNGLVK